MQLDPEVPVNIKGAAAKVNATGSMSRGHFETEYFLVRRQALWREKAKSG